MRVYTTLNDDNDLSAYDVIIDSELYDNDYDEVDVPQQEEQVESNILFE